jgi:hypothetical protein
MAVCQEEEISSFSISASVLQKHALQAGLRAVLVVPASLFRFSPEASPKDEGKTSSE